MPHKGFIFYSTVQSSKRTSIHDPKIEDREIDYGCMMVGRNTRHCISKLDGELWVEKEIVVDYHWLQPSNLHTETNAEVYIDHFHGRNSTAKLYANFSSDGYYRSPAELDEEDEVNIFIRSGREVIKNQVNHDNYLRFHQRTNGASP